MILRDVGGDAVVCDVYRRIERFVLAGDVGCGAVFCDRFSNILLFEGRDREA